MGVGEYNRICRKFWREGIVKAFTGNRVLTQIGLEKACILVKQGRVEAVLPSLPSGFTGPVEDAGDLVILPGLVDSHVHINEPGRTEWEGFETATQAAAAGGITTVVDMPLNCSPVTTSASALATKISSLQGKLWVDTGFWGGIISGSLEDLPALLKAGVLGVKSFMIDSGLDEFPHLSLDELSQATQALSGSRIPYLIHAEFDENPDATAQIDTSYESFLNSRPRGFENRAIEILIELSKKHGCKIHIVHLSSSDALEMLDQARAENLDITVETCPHYLLLHSEDISDGDTLFKCCPPIREKENSEKLWEALKQGRIDFVVSDHSPCTPRLKSLETGSFDTAWGGISSLQLSLPLIWTEARKRNFTLEELSRILSASPANLAGLAHRKGRISPGLDADLIFFNPDAKQTIHRDQIYHRHKLTPYVDREVIGVIEKTFLRGEPIFYDGTPVDKPLGQPLLRENL